MIIIAVDDEPLALEGCISAIRKVTKEHEIHGFNAEQDAIDFANNQTPDVAFLDVEMRKMGGIELARTLQSINPVINIIFVTGYSEYMGEAFDLYASGYIMKPVTEKKVRGQLEHLRYSVSTTSMQKLKIRTFGTFEVFDMKGIPVDFSYSRTKELLAVLIDANGAMRTFEQIMENLWMDEEDAGSHSSYLRNLFADMQRVFTEYGCSDALIRRRGEAGLIRDYFKCDYYDFLAGKNNDYVFAGEYMLQYSWAEYTLGRLITLSENR